MLDFTEGSTWFLAGLGVTLVVLLILFAVPTIARWCGQERGHGPHGA